jgi:hypothetical protein
LAILQELEQECTHARGISTDLAADAGQHTKPVPVPAEYQQHAQVFSEEESRRFPPVRSWDHAINFKPGSPESLNCKVYATTPKERINLRGWLDDMLARKYIEHANPDEAYIASPFFYLKKKDSSDRPVQDYRKANALTQQDFYPVLLIPPTIARICNASIFTKFDVCQGYNNIRIRCEDCHKAAFKTEFGIFIPNIMFFGLTNSPATFQRMMDSIFQRTINKHHLLSTEILVYMDDILIASSSGLAGHHAAVHDVLAVLEEHDLYLKPKKCIWEADSIDYLGLILEEGVTRMDLTKVEGVRNWATLTTKKHIRSFLGFCNFYCAFIRGFAKLAKPLNNLTKKEAPWVWGTMNRMPSIPSSAVLRKNQYYDNHRWTSNLNSKWTHPAMPSGWSSCSARKTASNTQWVSILPPSTMRNGITTYTTLSSSWSSDPLRTGRPT